MERLKIPMWSVTKILLVYKARKMKINLIAYNQISEKVGILWFIIYKASQRD